MDGRHTGRTDLPLLPEGETKAAALHTKLPGVLGDREAALVLTSPLKRALDTCRLAGYGDQAQLEPDLVEWDYGLYEGRTTQEIQAERSGWDLFRDGCPGGETVSEVARRASRVIARLCSNRALTDQPTLLFAHGHVLRVLTAVWADFAPESARALPFETGAIGVLGWSHEARALARWNV